MSFNSTKQCNLTKSEISDIKSLKFNQGLVITPADKGNAIVILSQGQYMQGLQNLLSSNVYSTCRKSHLDNLMKEVKEVIHSSNFIDGAKKRALLPSYYQPGRLYISPKIHKPTLCFRPIISSINTPTHLLSKFMAKQLSTLFSLNPFSITNTAEFIECLKIHSSQQNIMISFDVQSMFTSIPVPDALEALSSRLQILQYSPQDKDSILKLVEVCTRPPVFTVQNKVYRQNSGLPMGDSLSPILSDIYMWSIEERLDTLPFQPIMWKRYVDDVFSLFQVAKQDVPGILLHLNQLDTHIQFTVEVEEDNSLPFLDVAVTRTNDSFATTVYRKPFSVALPPHRRSAHPYSQKMSAFVFYVQRAFTVCSNTDLLTEELNFIRHIAIDRGYPYTIVDNLVKKHCEKIDHPSRASTLVRTTANSTSQLPWLILPQSTFNITKISTICKHNFRCIFKPDLKISNFLHAPKDVPQGFDRPGIYYIPCECGQGYVGQTCRALRYRLSEHKTNVKYCKITTSNIASHAWTFGHNFKFSDSSLLKITLDPYVLNTFESAYILHNQACLVNDHFYPPLSSIWLRVNHQLKTLPPREPPQQDAQTNNSLTLAQTSSTSST